MGAFWGIDHPFNVSKPLQGEIQTNNRAELQAVICTLLLEVRPVEVRTDSAYVIGGLQRHRQNLPQPSPKHKSKTIKNADLWQELKGILDKRPEESVKFTKVKGHAATEDVVSGAASAEDKFGNDMADALAVAGATMNAQPGAAGLRKHNAIVFAVRVQKMMLTIVQARAEAERRPRKAEDDFSDGRCSISDASRSGSSSSRSSSSSQSSITASSAATAPG